MHHHFTLKKLSFYNIHVNLIWLKGGRLRFKKR